MDKDEIELMIKDCIKREKKLSPWEQIFIRSLQDKKTKLTKKQWDGLNKLWDRVTA